MLERTSTEYAPWHVIPCDRARRTRLILATSWFRRRGREEAAGVDL